MSAVNCREIEAIVANAPIGVLVTRDSQITRYNRKFSEMFGFVGDEGIGQPASTLYSSVEAYDALRALAGPLFAVGKPLQAELYMRSQEGIGLWIELTGYVLNTENAGEETVWFFEDRRVWQAARAALQQTLLENEAIFDHAQAGIAVIENHHVMRCNRRMNEILGYPQGGMTERSARIFYFPTQEFEEAGAEIYRVLGEYGVYSGEINMRSRDGRDLCCQVSARTLDSTDPLGKSIWIFDDVTERKEAERALAQVKAEAEAAVDATSRFLANMNHEIRTSMNAIIGLSHLIQKTELTTRQCDYAQKIHSAGTALLRIVNDIRDFSEIEAGQIDLECIDFSLDDILDNVAIVIGPRAQDKGLESLFDLPAGAPRFLRGDPLRLSQVLTSLAFNAVKFTETGAISVVFEQCDSAESKLKLRFEVRDVGIGMSAAEISRLFRPFAQTDEAACLMRADRRFADLPTIAVTAHSMAEERQHCLDSGMNDHLAKPIDPDELFRTLIRYGVGLQIEPAAAASVADSLFALPGLDAAAGLRRVGGKLDFYRKLLRQFVHGQSGVIQDIHIALAAANFQLASRLAHTLKGVAGNIGAMPLSHIAAEVDDAIREAPGGKATKVHLLRLGCALDELCTALAAELGTSATVSRGAKRQVSPGPIVEKLPAALQRSDGEVVNYFDAHADAVHEISPELDFATLTRLVTAREALKAGES